MYLSPRVFFFLTEKWDIRHFLKHFITILSLGVLALQQQRPFQWIPWLLTHFTSRNLLSITSTVYSDQLHQNRIEATAEQTLLEPNMMSFTTNWRKCILQHRAAGTDEKHNQITTVVEILDYRFKDRNEIKAINFLLYDSKCMCGLNTNK